MFSSNPFAEMSVFLPENTMQIYIALMIFSVIAGTLADMLYKKNGRYFAQHKKKSAALASKQLNAANKALLAVKTVAVEVATAGEFCNLQRRISHMMMFYGFILYLVTTIFMVYVYPTSSTPALIPILWNIGLILLLIGGYWFFFLLRVNVVKDGQPMFRLVLADLFIVTLLASASFALIWEIVQANANPNVSKITFGFYILFTTLLFCSVRWSKLAHMFFKPVVAFQRRVDEASGAGALPDPAPANDRS